MLCRDCSCIYHSRVIESNEQLDEFEFGEGMHDENIIYDWRHDGSGKNNCVPTAKTRFAE